MLPNTIRRMRANGLAQAQLGSRWRLAGTADGDR